MDLDIGKKFIQKKKFDQALSFFLNELENGNKSLRLYFFLGFVYFELNQIQNSIKYYKLALKIEPKSINILLSLANSNYVLGNFISAKSLYLKVIKMNKYNPRGYYGLYLINPQYLASKYLSDSINLKNFFDPVTLVLSPTFTKLVSLEITNGSKPERIRFFTIDMFNLNF